MRTAIYFLIGVIFIVLIGSFVPQQDTSDQIKVNAFLDNYQGLNAIASHIGLPLTSVFVSPIFYGLLASLYISLGACVIRRGRALIMRTIRRERRTPQYWGEWGSWLFHTSFFLLLVAVVWGKATGFQGITTIIEGNRFTETRASFDTLQEGLLFNGQHADYQVQLNKFTATYQANGTAQDYVSNVTVFDHGNPVLTKDIRVNEFLSYDNVAMYQQDYGWAPHIVVRNPSGVVVFDSAVEFFGENKSVQTGVLKVPDFNYTIPGAKQAIQIGAKMAIFPDAKTSIGLAADGSVDPASVNYAPGGAEARNPVIEMQLFVGDLGVNSGAAQNVNTLDTTKMQPYFDDSHPIPLTLGATVPLTLPGANGQPTQFTVTFSSLHQYSLFLVKKDNGVPLVYGTFILIMTGLLTKMYLKPLLQRHRRHRKAQQKPQDTSEVVSIGPT